MNCPKCGTDLPHDAVFCVECGAHVAPAATGPTVRIDQASGPACPACGTTNPAYAAFCVTCGRTLDVLAQNQPAPVLHVPQPSAPVPVAPRVPVPPPASKHRQRHHHGWEGASGGIFMLGLALLFLTGTFWPGILILIGLTGFLSSMGQNRSWAGVQGLVWMVGLALLLSTGRFWPGILFLIGISACFNGSCFKGKHKHYRRGW